MGLQLKFRAYLQLIRWHSPSGTFLLLSPTLSALWLASTGAPSLNLHLIFILGAFLLRSAGCAINDATDFRVDKFVQRTKNRPIVTEKISLLEAWFLAGFLIFLGFLLVLLTNPATIFLATLSLPVLILYPYTKRWIDCPQVILGLAFSFGIPMAFSAILGGEYYFWKIFGVLPTNSWLLFFANFAWILAYDTIYALVDIDDDKKIGVRTSAILFANKVWEAIVAFYGIYLILSAILLFQLDNIVLSMVIFFLMVCQVVIFCLKIKNLDRIICLQVFGQNHRLGWLFLAGVILQKIQ